MKIHIKYFGAIEELTKVSEENLHFDLEEIDLEDIKRNLMNKYKGIDELSFQLAVNQSLIENIKVKDGDEVALLPPFAGG